MKLPFILIYIRFLKKIFNSVILVQLVIFTYSGFIKNIERGKDVSLYILSNK